jgi:hypothetical protein
VSSLPPCNFGVISCSDLPALAPPLRTLLAHLLIVLFVIRVIGLNNLLELIGVDWGVDPLRFDIEELKFLYRSELSPIKLVHILIRELPLEGESI